MCCVGLRNYFVKVNTSWLIVTFVYVWIKFFELSEISCLSPKQKRWCQTVRKVLLLVGQHTEMTEHDTLSQTLFHDKSGGHYWLHRAMIPWQTGITSIGPLPHLVRPKSLKGTSGELNEALQTPPSPPPKKQTNKKNYFMMAWNLSTTFNLPCFFFSLLSFVKEKK